MIDTRGFSTFAREMVQANLAQDKPPLDLSEVPRKVLEQVTHVMVMSSLMQQPAPTLDLLIGPTPEYQHMITGIAVHASENINVFLQSRGSWFSFVVEDGVNIVFAERAGEWVVLDNIEDAKLIGRVAAVALRYLAGFSTRIYEAKLSRIGGCNNCGGEIEPSRARLGATTCHDCPKPRRSNP